MGGWKGREGAIRDVWGVYRGHRGQGGCEGAIGDGEA